MPAKLSAAFTGLIGLLAALQYFVPLSYFTGKACDVRFEAYLVASYLDWSKQDNVLPRDLTQLPTFDPHERWAFRNITVDGRRDDGTICFAGYQSLKPSARQAPPRDSTAPPLVVQPDGDSFCVRKDAVASIRYGYLGWDR
jgi:hypothetical protein